MEAKRVKSQEKGREKGEKRDLMSSRQRKSAFEGENGVALASEHRRTLLEAREAQATAADEEAQVKRVAARAWERPFASLCVVRWGGAGKTALY